MQPPQIRSPCRGPIVSATRQGRKRDLRPGGLTIGRSEGDWSKITTWYCVTPQLPRERDRGYVSFHPCKEYHRRADKIGWSDESALPFPPTFSPFLRLTGMGKLDRKANCGDIKVSAAFHVAAKRYHCRSSVNHRTSTSTVINHNLRSKLVNRGRLPNRATSAIHRSSSVAGCKGCDGARSRNGIE